MKMTTKTVREAFSAEVSKEIISEMKHYRTKYASVEIRNNFFTDEDSHIKAILDGKKHEFSVGGEWHGTGNAPICQEVKIPVGMVVIQTRWFLGKGCVEVNYNNGLKQVA